MPGTETFSGQTWQIINTTGTTQVKTSSGRVARVLMQNAGSADATLAVYDHASANGNQIWYWDNSRGVGEFDIDCPMKFGIRVVVAGTTAPTFTLIYS